jgi:hypothetical protein
MTNLANKPCICSAFTNIATGENTGCFSDTKNLFAPGHDAKLKGLLIRAGVAGHKISDGITGEHTPESTASRFGFLGKVTDGIARGTAKKAAKAVTSDFDAMVDADVAKRQAKAAKMARKPVEAKPVVTAKVGRWTYEGTVTDSPEWGPQFTYTDKKGNTQTVTSFTLA